MDTSEESVTILYFDIFGVIVTMREESPNVL